MRFKMRMAAPTDIVGTKLTEKDLNNRVRLLQKHLMEKEETSHIIVDLNGRLRYLESIKTLQEQTIKSDARLLVDSIDSKVKAELETKLEKFEKYDMLIYVAHHFMRIVAGIALINLFLSTSVSAIYDAISKSSATTSMGIFAIVLTLISIVASRSFNRQKTLEKILDMRDRSTNVETHGIEVFNQSHEGVE